MTRTAYRACNLCEALCGLEFKIDGNEIVSIRGDDADPFSRGHICPKAVALKDIHEDPDRLRQPMRRTGSEWQTISWEEAIAYAADRITAIQAEHGNDAFGFYAGNPSVHNFGTLWSLPRLARVLKTKSAFSATSVDQLPQQLVSFFMFGHQFLIPIPDIDHTQHLLILGGNPLASNGSMMSAPDVTVRLKDIQKRGGKVVVVDPRRTETAAVASEHHFIKPGSDAALLMAMINVLRAEGRLATSQSPVNSGWTPEAVPEGLKDRPERAFNKIRNAGQLAGLDEALAAIAHVTPEVAERATGISAANIRRLALEFADAPAAICYGRLGTTVQAFGTLCQWLVQLLNIVTGNLDRVGGTMPTQPVLPLAGPGTRPGHYAEWRSRVRGLPESGGELPVAALAEEILTPGAGQIRGLITVCGNPVLSTPNGRQVEQALESLDFMVSVDIYLNETTRHAHLILPPASSLQHDHYDTVFNAFAIREVSRYNEALWPRADDELCDWEVFNALGTALAARNQRNFSALPPPKLAIAGALQASGNRHGVTMEKLLATPHGLDLGALSPSLFARLETPDRKVNCAPTPVLADIARFNREVLESAASPLQLIGRRHVRSNNSWMHQYHRLTKGKPRHQLWMHPDDLSARGLQSGQQVELRSAKGSIKVPVEASSDVMPGVVCLPHGWGHHREGTRLSGAVRNAGASYNDISDETRLDAVSGNAALNGVPVEVVGA